MRDNCGDREHVLPGKYKQFLVNTTDLPGVPLQQPIPDDDSNDVHRFPDDDITGRPNDYDGLVAMASGIDQKTIPLRTKKRWLGTIATHGNVPCRKTSTR